VNAIHELAAGQSHQFELSPLRVTLTGTMQGHADGLTVGVILRAVDQAERESVTVRMTDAQIILTPEPRRLRLVAYPTAGGTFDASTKIGLTVMTEGAAVVSEQVLVAPTDVGALPRHELAVLEFATDRAILTVAAPSRPAVPDDPRDTDWKSGDVFGPATTAAPLERPNDDTHPWIRPARYAMRDAAKLRPSGVAGTGDGRRWAVALDGSASMGREQLREAAETVLALACGVLVEWTGWWAANTVVAGVDLLDVPEGRTDPAALIRSAFDGREPSSWWHVATAARQLAARVGEGGSVLMVGDGVPGDLAILVGVARSLPGVRFVLLSFGDSRHSLQSDGGHVSWQTDAMSGSELGDGVRNLEIVTVRLRADGSPLLEESRAAELAVRLTDMSRATA